MKRFFRSLFRSFFATLFLTLVCGGFLGLVAVPAVGQRLAAPQCEGTIEVERTAWSQSNGESGVNIRYLCTAANGVQTPVSTGQILLSAATYYVGGMVLIIWPLLFLLFFAGYGKFVAKTQHLREKGIPATAKIVNTTRSAVTINSRSEQDVGVIIHLEVEPPDGQSYRTKTHETLHVTELMKLTPGLRVGVHIDPKKRERVAITDWNVAGVARSQFDGFSQNQFAAHVGNHVEKLQQLKQMVDAGLITSAEFERKKQEILSEM